MAEEPTTHEYPHQTSDVVTDADLAHHFATNPDAYHPALQPHVENHLVRKMGGSAEFLKQVSKLLDELKLEPVVPTYEFDEDGFEIIPEADNTAWKFDFVAPGDFEIEDDIVAQMHNNPNVYYWFQNHFSLMLREGHIPAADHTRFADMLLTSGHGHEFYKLIGEGLLKIDKMSLLKTVIGHEYQGAWYALIGPGVFDIYSEDELVSAVGKSRLLDLATVRLAPLLSTSGQEKLLANVAQWGVPYYDFMQRQYNFDKLSGERRFELIVQNANAETRIRVVNDMHHFDGLSLQIAYDVFKDSGHLSMMWHLLGRLNRDNVVFDARELVTAAIDSGVDTVAILVGTSYLDAEVRAWTLDLLVREIPIELLAQHVRAFPTLTAEQSNRFAKLFIDSGYASAVASRVGMFPGITLELLQAAIDRNGNKKRRDPSEPQLQIEWDDETTQEIDEQTLISMVTSIKSEPNISYALLKAAAPLYSKDTFMTKEVIGRLGDLSLTGDQLLEVMKCLTVNVDIAERFLGPNDLGIDQFLSEQQHADYKQFVDSKDLPLADVKFDHEVSDYSGTIDYVTASRPGTEFHKRSVEINRELRKEGGEYELINEAIEQRYAQLYEALVAQFDESYADQMFGEAHSKNELFPIYRRIVADAITGIEATDGPASLSKKLLGDRVDIALGSANDTFIQVLKNDVPLYDKLYSEWDAKRVGQREFEEVFLGRDGVYAYIGRRAQLHARQQRLGLRPADVSEDDTQLAMPTYLVYPSGFRDYVSPTTKKVYVDQKLRNPEAAHFFDTGYAGSIPDDIMSLVGVAPANRDRKIRLLSSSRRVRTVAGVESQDNEGSRNVARIEDNAKDEQSAEGIMLDENGELQHFATPSSPMERLKFRFSELALHRHYYQAESKKESQTLYKQIALGNGRELRVNPSFESRDAEFLTELFSAEQIGKTLQDAATDLRIAQPEDPFPNEIVFTVPLPSGEAIVKPAAPIVGEDVLDEFEALVLMQSVHISAPKPIARVFTAKESGFTIMESAPGISGRTLPEYFEKNEVSDDEKMSIVTEIHKAMTSIATKTRIRAGIDRHWELGDFMIDIKRREDGSFEPIEVTPVNFDGAQVYDRSRTQSVTMGDAYDRMLGIYNATIPAFPFATWDTSPVESESEEYYGEEGEEE